MKSPTPPPADYVVVKDYKTAQSLLMNYKGKDLAGKWVIVAPKGLRLVSKKDISKLPQVKEIITAAVEDALKEERRKNEYKK